MFAIARMQNPGATDLSVADNNIKINMQCGCWFAEENV